MPLEGTITIDGLNNSWPLDGDGVSEGDDHIRQQKSVLKNILPGASGQGLASPLTATEDEFNYLVGVTSAIQAQLDALVTADLGLIPVGAIIMYNGSFASIPANFQLCDGTNGTPDLQNEFVYGTNIEGELGNIGGSPDAITVSHTHGNGTLGTSTNGAHTHTVSTGSPQLGGTLLTAAISASGTATVPSDGSHTHNINGSIASTGSSGTDANIPNWVKLAYIRRMT